MLKRVPVPAQIVTLVPQKIFVVITTVPLPRIRFTGFVTAEQGSVAQGCGPEMPVASATPPVGGRSAIHAAIFAEAVDPLNCAHTRVLPIFFAWASAIREVRKRTSTIPANFIPPD